MGDWAGKGRWHTKKWLFTLSLLLCRAITRGQDSQPTFLEHVTVVNVVTGAEAKDQTVRIEGTRIVSIAPSRPEDRLHGAINATGQYLIPGLWDMHVHINDGTELPLYVANGVTGVRIMAGERDTAALRRKLSKQTLSPDIYLASAMIESPPSSLSEEAATINPAKFLSRSEQLGTVEPGKLANLVLLGGDPLADIKNTTKIEAVWLEGKYFDKAALADILSKAKEEARQ
jgi:imidazolonepropionase-like amidohydrolase